MAVGRRELMLGTLGMGLLPAPRSSPAIQSAVRRTARSAPWTARRRGFRSRDGRCCGLCQPRHLLQRRVL